MPIMKPNLKMINPLRHWPKEFFEEVKYLVEKHKGLRLDKDGIFVLERDCQNLLDGYAEFGVFMRGITAKCHLDPSDSGNVIFDFILPNGKVVEHSQEMYDPQDMRGGRFNDRGHNN